ncbi:Hypothetical predicted protein [Olea europaea subsp. europaea]|uniref:Endonuclease/exonuclease/phosphatase domain-containing protein n=1 Tax=Olea europaea subsp. europaea TaxID=158383 RepID=A0A8S0PZF5_OLEEU|nr:Hypothetical predicted protein [Olea europaea subsp. europaea]
MSMTPGPLCRKFVPVEQSKISSIIICEECFLSILSISLSQVAQLIQRLCFDTSISAELVIEEKIDYNDLVNSVQDGRTAFMDKDCDSLIHETESELKDGLDLQDTRNDRGDPNDPRVRLKRDCVGIMAAFRFKNPSSHHVIIANTHIYWDPEWADVKLAQAKYLLSRLAKFKKMVADKFDCTPSVLVAGDFNSVPGDQVYQYIVSGTTSVGAENAEDLPIPLSSVYAFTRGEPHFTNCTSNFIGTLDYILFSPSEDIKPISYLELPERESSDVSDGLPNYYHPSDHLPIGAEFEVFQA